MHNEPLVGLALQPVHTLNVVRGSKGCRHECLSFPARKNRRTMSTRQDTGLNPNGPDRFEVTFIRTLPFVQNLVAEDPFF